MAKSKYTIVKSKTGKSKKVVVEGVKKVLYRKEGSMKLYVLSKGRMMNLVKYKKMKMKGGNVEQDGGKKSRKPRKTRNPRKTRKTRK
jgi:hypothetical protein